MSNVPDDLVYTTEHEWVRLGDEPDLVEIGITDYAQGELGDIVFVNLPTPGDHYDESQPFGTIEAVKAVSDLYCPISGEVTEVNEALDADPAVVNRSPYEDGWMIRLRVDDPNRLSSLLDPDAYRAQIGG